MMNNDDYRQKTIEGGLIVVGAGDLSSKNKMTIVQSPVTKSTEDRNDSRSRFNKDKSRVVNLNSINALKSNDQI